ncbi:uncharacterized protein LOC101860911 [Aplysia californica]|uniref:Uncharacterized protein LOC101860911 n=1 Tax=Aplysia californica TaxID=6500 RepID=A0ABM0JY17_APLCA|nr:uncharacterized protein LOC101860911 [Aplysia californica]
MCLVMTSIMRDRELVGKKVKQKSSARPHVCTTCEASFSKASDLKRHERSHTGERPYKCSTCGQAFRQSATLKVHERKHTGECPYKCTTCGESFKYANILKTHLKTHSEEKPFVCQVCDSRFAKISDLKRHERVHYIEEVALQCNPDKRPSAKFPNAAQECIVNRSESTDTADKLKDKVAVISLSGTENRKEVQCSCGSVFKTSRQLKAHKKEKFCSATLLCDMCGAVFLCVSSLRVHLKRHLGDTPFSCSLCSRAFPLKSLLKKHEESHTKTKQYSCKICSSSFSLFGNLKIHMRIHTGDRPYSCDICGRKFAHSQALTKHGRVHSKARPFSCSSCGASFAWPGPFQKHLKSCQGGEGNVGRLSKEDVGAGETRSSVSCERIETEEVSEAEKSGQILNLPAPTFLSLQGKSDRDAAVALVPNSSSHPGNSHGISTAEGVGTAVVSAAVLLVPVCSQDGNLNKQLSLPPVNVVSASVASCYVSSALEVNPCTAKQTPSTECVESGITSTNVQGGLADPGEESIRMASCQARAHHNARSDVPGSCKEADLRVSSQMLTGTDSQINQRPAPYCQPASFHETVGAQMNRQVHLDRYAPPNNELFCGQGAGNVSNSPDSGNRPSCSLLELLGHDHWPVGQVQQGNVSYGAVSSSHCTDVSALSHTSDTKCEIYSVSRGSRWQRVDPQSKGKSIKNTGGNQWDDASFYKYDTLHVSKDPSWNRPVVTKSQDTANSAKSISCWQSARESKADTTSAWNAEHFPQVGPLSTDAFSVSSNITCSSQTNTPNRDQLSYAFVNENFSKSAIELLMPSVPSSSASTSQQQMCSGGSDQAGQVLDFNNFGMSMAVESQPHFGMAYDQNSSGVSLNDGEKNFMQMMETSNLSTKAEKLPHNPPPVMSDNLQCFPTLDEILCESEQLMAEYQKRGGNELQQFPQKKSTVTESGDPKPAVSECPVSSVSGMGVSGFSTFLCHGLDRLKVSGHVYEGSRCEQEPALAGCAGGNSHEQGLELTSVPRDRSVDCLSGMEARSLTHGTQTDGLPGIRQLDNLPGQSALPGAVYNTPGFLDKDLAWSLSAAADEMKEGRELLQLAPAQRENRSQKFSVIQTNPKQFVSLSAANDRLRNERKDYNVKRSLDEFMPESENIRGSDYTSITQQVPDCIIPMANLVDDETVENRASDANFVHTSDQIVNRTPCAAVENKASGNAVRSRVSSSNVKNTSFGKGEEDRISDIVLENRTPGRENRIFDNLSENRTACNPASETRPYELHTVQIVERGTENSSSDNHYMVQSDEAKDKKAPDSCEVSEYACAHVKGSVVEKEVFVCGSCGQTFGDKDSLRQHVTERHTEGETNAAFICSECGSCFSQRNQLTRHELTHSDRHRPHQCSQCQATFTQLSSLKAHLSSHSGERLHKCTECDASYMRKENLKLHMKQSHKSHPDGSPTLDPTSQGQEKGDGSNQFSCSSCEKKFSSIASLKSHVKVHNKRESFQCDKCEASFTFALAFERHKLTHKKGKQMAKCEVCGSEFTRQSNLKKHMMIHTGQKPFTCEVCGSSFTQKANLQVHMRTHTGEKPYTCNTCGAKFAHSQALKTHTLFHGTQKDFVCHSCGKAFLASATLEKHIRTVHSGDKQQWPCRVCKAVLSSSSSLRRHMRTHGEDLPHQCSVCSQRFAKPAHLKIHMGTHNKTHMRSKKCQQEVRD